MRVAVLIVNWNGGDLLTRCLESLEQQRRRPDHVIVVDNASSDDSLKRARHLLKDVELIQLPSNVGFARGNNLAAHAARQFDALALLNPDAVAEPGWLEALVRAAERHPETASFASRMLLASTPLYLDGAGDSYHVSGRAWRNGHRILSTTWPAEDAEVFGPCAAAALYRREAFDEVGGFDEQYFCYFEDVDLAFRLRLRGYRLAVRACRRRQSRGLGAERIPERLRGLSRRAECSVDLRQEHAGPAVVDVPSAAHRLERGRAAVLSVARSGEGGLAGQVRRPARSSRRAQAPQARATRPAGRCLDAAARVQTRRARALSRALLEADLARHPYSEEGRKAERREGEKGKGRLSAFRLSAFQPYSDVARRQTQRVSV
jgi:hypothetical protein